MRHHIFILLGLAAAAAGTALAQAVDTTADVVYGQRGRFTTALVVGADLLNGPQGVAFDSNSNLYVADANNHRVLFYLAGSTTPTRVYGQGGSFDSNTANKGGISADSLNSPSGLALDRDGNLYVADQFNHRVLVYAPGSTTATRVYGQSGSFTTNTPNVSNTSANSLAQPTAIAFDSTGKVYIAESSNNRVLAYPPGSTTANAVWGQPNFTTTAGVLTATGLSGPRGLVFDSADNLYVADGFHHRVLFFPAGSTTATRVYGQANFTSSGAGSVNTMNIPQGIALDSSGSLFVADSSNSRVLVYPAGSTTASAVYGQSSFTTGTLGTSATGLNIPRGLAIRSDGSLFVADTNNSRVVGYPPASTTATVVYGQGGDFTTGSVRPEGFERPRGVAVDRSSNLYVADVLNHRILYYPAGSTTATRVYGQGGSFTTNAAATTADGLRNPWGLTVDNSGNLYVADQNNNRVLFYPAGSTTATRVYGQGGDFTTNTANKGGGSANSLNQPAGVAVDSADNVYIADQLNHRVLYYPAGSTTATRVYGQGGSFTTGTANIGGRSANSLNRPSAVALDSAGNLYVGDAANFRVLYYPVGSTTATRVYGNTVFTTAVGGTSATRIGDANVTNPAIGISLDNAGNLYVSDTGNHRVLYFAAGSTTATQVYGQVNFTSNTIGTIPSANTLNDPVQVAVDTVGNLFVAESRTRRVLRFNAPPSVAVTVNTSPPGRSFSVNGTPYTGAQTLNLAAGASHTVATTSPQPGAAGTQYVFANWSNGGAISQSVTLSAPTTLTATFTTQHLLTTAASGPGSVTPATGYQNAGLVNVTATPTACGVFAGWSGTTVTSGQVTLTAPATLTGRFTPVSGAPVKGSLQTVRGTPIRYRQAVSVQNTTASAADVSIVLDTFGSGVTVLAPVSATGTTTSCTGVAGRNFYTVPGVAPGAFGTVTFDFAAPSGAGVIYKASGIVGAGPR